MKRRSLYMPPFFTSIVVVALFLLMSGSASATSPQPIHCTCAGWRIVSSPNAGTSSNFLNGVAAISAKNVWAVGSSSSNNGQALVEHWNGSAWSVVASPNPSNALYDSLSAVTALAADNVWAVGSYNNTSNIQQALVEHWNGIAWSVMPSPNVSTSFTELSAISALSATDIWAAGDSSDINGYQTLIEHWNGNAWSIVSSSGVGRFTGITAIAANNVWAVGSTSSTNANVTLIEHWNGIKWSIASSPSPGLTSNSLNAIAAISANNVWAVGDASNSVGPRAPYTPLLEHWNGSTWSIVNSPFQGTSDFITGIAAVSANSIWVVGDYRTSLDPMGPYFTLVEYWNGTTWSIVNSPSNSSAIASDLVSAARVPTTSKVWAVGFVQDSISQTLIEAYC